MNKEDFQSIMLRLAEINEICMAYDWRDHPEAQDISNSAGQVLDTIDKYYS